jgi:hypothetical protein
MKLACDLSKVPLDTLEKFYEATRVACEEAKNEVSHLNIAVSAQIVVGSIRCHADASSCRDYRRNRI